MQRIVIKNFGPIKDVDIPIHDFMIFIGPQASGKSTIAKAIDFLKISPTIFPSYLRTLNSTFLLKDEEKAFEIILTDISKEIRARFIDLFGDMISNATDKSSILLSYNIEQNLSVSFNFSLRTVTVTLNANLILLLKTFFTNIYSKYKNTKLDAQLLDTNIQAQWASFPINTLGRRSPSTFIPAGRSIFSILSNSFLLDNKVSNIYSYRIYARYISYISRNYNQEAGRFFNDKQKEVMPSVLNLAEGLIYKILKGKYTKSNNKDFIKVENDISILLENASSGQQEALWILLSILEPIKYTPSEMFIIEEPEAHLYPEAQKYISELIALCVNQPENQIVITTHSPYILSSLNNLLYANEVGKIHPDQVEKVIDKNLWLDYDRVMAYFVDEGKVRSIMDDELRLIKSEEIDSASRIINEEYGKLSDIEFSK